jgi:O-antigen/teichoic acid export membrane protein
LIHLLQRDWQRARHSILAHNAGWMMLGQTSNLVVQALYFAVLGRLLGSTEYGIYVGAFALVSTLSAFSSMGSGTLLLRYVSIDRSKFGAYWGNMLLTTTCFGGILIGVAHLCAPRILNPMSASLVLFAGIAGCFCGEITRNAAIVFQAYEEMQITAFVGFSSNVARCAAAIGLVVAYQHVSALRWAIAAMLVSMLVATVSTITVLYRYGRPTFSFDLLFRRMPEGFNYSFATSTGTIYNDVDKSILSHYGFNQANGIYSLAYRVIDAASSPGAAILESILPRLFREGGRDIPELTRFTRRVLTRSILVSGGVALILYVAAPLAPLLAGRSFADSVAAIRWLCLIPLLRSVHGVTGRGMLGMGKQTYRTMSQLVVAGFNLTINLYWIPLYGWKGAAWSSLLSDGLLAVINSALFVMLCRRAAASQGGPLHSVASQ